uniref:Uncharacterized protein n=1 Tax=Nannospalax galili TaxID=1026970 RepID=A0A8C6R0R4_NANGA
MSDAGSRMEVCPYCKKPFKRLKSHLPYCKMIRPTISADQQVHLSKPATLSHAKKETGPPRVVTKADRRALETKTEKSNTKRISDRPEGTATSFPLRVVCLKKADTTKAGTEIRDQNQLSFQVLKHTEPKITLQRVRTAQSCVSDASSPRRDLAKGGCESRESPCDLSEMEAPLLVGSMEQRLSNQDRKYSSVLLNEKPATSINLKLDTIDPQRQGPLVKLLDVPTNNNQSPKALSSGVQRVRLPSVLSKESSSTGVSPNLGHTATPDKTSDSLVLGLHTGLLGKVQDKGHQEKELGGKLFGSKRSAEKSVSPTGRQDLASVIPAEKNSRTGGAAMKAGPQEEEPLWTLSTPPEAACGTLLSAAESGTQSLASLTLKPLQEERAQFCGHHQVPAVTLLVESKEKALPEPKSACQHQALKTGYHTESYSAQHPVSTGSLVSHVAADSKALPTPVGLEWFPELYPGYVGLGVLPRRSLHWNSVTQMPLLATSQGGSVSQGKLAHFPEPSGQPRMPCA